MTTQTADLHARAAGHAHSDLTPLDLACLTSITLIASFTPIMVRLSVAGSGQPGQTGLPPILGGAMRFGIASIILLAILLPRRRLRPIARKDWLRVVLVAMACVPINQFGFWKGCLLASASHAAIIYAGTPVAVTLMSCLLKIERWSVTTIVAAVLALVGVAIIMAQSGLNLSPAFLEGDLLLAVAMLTWSIYLVGSRPLNAAYGSLSSQTWIFLVGTAISLPLVSGDAVGLQWSHVAPVSWLGLGYLAIMVAGVNFFLFNWSNLRQPPSRVTTFSNAAYPLTIIWTTLLGSHRDQLNRWFLLGAAFLLAGMVAALKRPRPKIVPLPEPVESAEST